MLHTAVAGDISKGVTSVANIDFIWTRLLFCHKSVGSSIHGSVLIESGLHIAQICEALGCFFLCVITNVLVSCASICETKLDVSAVPAER